MTPRGPFERARALRVVALVLGLAGALGLAGHFVDAQLLFPDYWFAAMPAHVAASLVALAAGLHFAARRLDGGRSPLFERADQRIAFTAAGVLVAVTLGAGIATFALLQGRVQALVRDELLLTLARRADVVQDLVRLRETNAEIAATRPAVLRNLRAIHAGRDDGSNLDNVRAVAEGFAKQGFSAIAYYGPDGKRVAAAGRAADAPDLAVALATPAQAELLWRDGFVLRHRLPMRDAAGRAGEVVTEQPLPVLTRLAQRPPGQGETWDMGLCVRREHELACFPQRLNPKVFSTRLFADTGEPLPMTRALRGESGASVARDYRQRYVLAAYGPVGDLGLGMVVKVDAAEVFAPIRERLLVAAGALLAFIALGALLLRWQVTPLAARLVAALGETGAGLQRAQSVARLGHVITGPDGAFESWSSTLPQLIGVDPRRMPASTRAWLELLHPEDRGKFRAKSLEAAASGARVEVDYRLRRADGAWMHVHQFIEPLGELPEAGAGGRWFSTLQDVTERKQAEEARARLAAIVESSEDAIIGKSLDGTVTSWNRGAEKLFGYAAAEMLGKPVSLLIPPGRLAEEAAILARLARGERIDHFETVRKRKDGSLVEVSVSISPVLDAEGRVVGASKIARDVGELAALTRRLVTLQEKERRDIARELHDRVGQNLSALTINLSMLQGAGELAARIAESRKLVEETALLVQDVLTELKPPMLASYGLVDALRWHGREFARRTGVEVEVADAASPERLSPEVEMALFRVAQAALNNVAQHAGATRVQVSLERRGARIVFRVQDDGRGFDVARAMASGRWGLSGMRERAEAIDGELRVESAPGRGAAVVVELAAAA